jgi:hypothetical protein
LANGVKYWSVFADNFVEGHNSMKFFLFILFLFASSCGNQKSFHALKNKTLPIEPEYVLPKIEICTVPPNKETDQMVIVFAIDITGSNAGADGSDPDRKNRYDNLIDWIDRRLTSGIDTTHEKYALIEFSMDGQLKNGGAYKTDEPTMNIEDFRKLVIAQKSASRDNNGTPYLQTINSVQEILQDEVNALKKKHEEELKKDSKAKQTTTEALAIFLSDGQPCTQEDGSILDFYGQPAEAPACVNFGSAKVDSILAKVKSLVEDLPNHPVYGKYISNVTMNTGFYQTKDNPYAKKLLEDMSIKGKGVFFDFSNGAKIDYDQVIDPKTRSIQVDIMDWEIKNLNLVLDENTEKYMPDADGDGLPDDFEYPAYCKTQYSCNKSGIRDGVYYAIYRKSCPTKIITGGDVVCDENVKACIKNTKGEYLDRDGDGLLQCEEAILASNDEKFDSNNDKILDSMALYRGYFLTDAEENIGNPATMDYDGDGYNDYLELTKMFTPRKTKNSDIPGLEALERVMVSKSYDQVTGRKCMNYEIKHLMHYTDSDLIEVTIMDKQVIGSGIGSLRIARKKLVNGVVSIQATDFKSIVVKE